MTAVTNFSARNDPILALLLFAPRRGVRFVLILEGTDTHLFGVNLLLTPLSAAEMLDYLSIEQLFGDGNAISVERKR